MLGFTPHQLHRAWPFWEDKPLTWPGRLTKLSMHNLNRWVHYPLTEDEPVWVDDKYLVWVVQLTFTSRTHQPTRSTVEIPLPRELRPIDIDTARPPRIRRFFELDTDGRPVIPDVDILDDQSLWPAWPRLDVANPRMRSLGIAPHLGGIGSIYGHKRGRSKYAKVRIETGQDGLIVYGTAAEAVKLGWTVRRDIANRSRSREKWWVGLDAETAEGASCTYGSWPPPRERYRNWLDVAAHLPPVWNG